MSKKSESKAQKEPEQPAPVAEAPAAPATVRVIVLCASISEGGTAYAHGETFETTPERASALGDSVALAHSAE